MPRGIPKNKPTANNVLANYEDVTYNLSIAMNGKVFERNTNDIKAELQAFRPEDVFTEVYITITKGMANFVRRFTLPNAKKLFRDEETLDIFLNNLLF